MGIESIPKENSDWDQLQEEWSRAVDALGSDNLNLLQLTNRADNK